MNGPVGAEVLQMLNRESDLGWNSTHGGGDDPPLYGAVANLRNSVKIKEQNEF